MAAFGSDDYEPNWFHERFPPEQLTKRRSHQWRANVRSVMFILALVVSLLPAFFFNGFLFNGNMDPVWVLVGALPGLIAVLCVLLIASMFVKTVFGLQSLQRGFQFAMMCLFGRPRPFRYPFAIISQGKIREQDRKKFVANRQLGGPAKLVIHSDSAVVLERYGQITRIEGPGIVFLERFERIREILDLRPQTRSETPSARVVYTRDGIPVEAEITVRFQLRHGPPTPGSPYPVDPAALRAATEAETMRYGGSQPLTRFNWQDRVMGNFGSTLRAIVARMTLDELFEPADVNKDPRDEISREMLERLRQQCAPLGVIVLDLILGPFKPVNPQIEQQLRAAWQAGQRAQARVEEAHGEAEAMLARETAYAYAQLEIMLAIDRGFQKLADRDKKLPPYFIALRFLETLRHMASSPGLGPFLPLETMRTLEMLNDRLLGESPSQFSASGSTSNLPESSSSHRLPKPGEQSEPDAGEGGPVT